MNQEIIQKIAIQLSISNQQIENVLSEDLLLGAWNEIQRYFVVHRSRKEN